MVLLEWNINKRTKAVNSPVFVIDNILKNNPDVICLVEYYEDYELENQLKDYHIEKSAIDSGNQILIAVKKSFDSSGIEVICSTEERNCYNFLHIRLKTTGLSIIGVRMLTGEGKNSIDAEKQTPPLKRYLSALREPFVCIGDYNIREFRMYKWFDNIKLLDIEETSDYLEQTSFFFKDKYEPDVIGSFGVLDHILCSDKINGKVGYSWDFVNDCEIYPSKQNLKLGTYWNIPIGYPDHGMLICNIEIQE